jgi:hypothetical protein
MSARHEWAFANDSESSGRAGYRSKGALAGMRRCRDEPRGHRAAYARGHPHPQVRRPEAQPYLVSIG